MLCLKPTTSARNDILLKQGDFIEEIIFVKSGKIQDIYFFHWVQNTNFYIW